MPVVTFIVYWCLYIFFSHATVLMKWTFEFEIWISQKSHNPVIKCPRLDWSRERSACPTDELSLQTWSHLVFLLEVKHLLKLKYVHCFVSLYPLWRGGFTFQSIHVQISTPAKMTWFGGQFTSKSASLQKWHDLAANSRPNQHPCKNDMIWLYFNLSAFIKSHPSISCQNWHPYIFVMISLQFLSSLSDSFLFLFLINLCFIDDKDQQIIVESS